MNVTANVRPAINLESVAWFGAHVVFAIAECATLFVGWKSYQHNHHLLLPVATLCLSVMPWVGQRDAKK